MEANRSHILQGESTKRAHGAAPGQGRQAPDPRKPKVSLQVSNSELFTWLDKAHPHDVGGVGGAISLTLFTDSNVEIIPNHPHRNMFDQISGHYRYLEKEIQM